jgi:dGTPase
VQQEKVRANPNNSFKVLDNLFTLPLMAQVNKLYSSGDYQRYIETPNKEGDSRSGFRRDFGRLIHSPAFRRLQGKTQLFPGTESDFFRNRLTHSLEVAQIAKSIAINLNSSDNYLLENGLFIDTDLVEFAALAHDLGHPPFGHVGEDALDVKMKEYGGYEGNAQTLRILSTLEKKVFKNHDQVFNYDNNEDNRAGLNLTFRTLASVLKYHKEIELKREHREHTTKGYYFHDQHLVNGIITNVIGEHIDKWDGKDFKTIECCIMDIADDIAYCTYDLEDCLKAGFLNLFDLFSADYEMLERVRIRVEKNMAKEGFSSTYTTEEIRTIIKRLLGIDESLIKEFTKGESFDSNSPYTSIITSAYKNFKRVGLESYTRTNLTSKLVHNFMMGIEVVPHEKDIYPLTRVILKKETREEVEVLKNFVFISQIDSSRLRIPEFRGTEIVNTIYEYIVEKPNGHTLLPDDFGSMYLTIHQADNDDQYKNRLIVDFIAGMTDRYAIEFYGRLKSENPQTIFKPL